MKNMDFLELTKEVQCVSCFDKYVLEYFIDDCFVHIENTRPTTINVDKLSLEDENQIQKWYKKNIYDLPLYQRFISQ